MNQFGYFLLVILLTGFGVYKSAGQTQSGQLSILAGATHDRLIDEAYTNNRLKYTGTNFYLYTSWERVKAASFLNVSFQGSKGDVHTSDTELEANNYYAKLAVSYGKQVASYSLADSIQRLYLGGQLSSANYILEDILGSTAWYTGNVTVTFNHTLNFFLHQSRRLGKKGRVDISLVIPVVGWVRRSKYEDGINQELEWAWIDKNIFEILFEQGQFKFFRPWAMPELTVRYGYRIGEHASLSAAYQFRYVSNKDLEPLNFYSSGLTVGFQFHLKSKK